MTLLDSWNKEYTDSQWVYTPKKLGVDKVYKIVIHYPEKLGDQDFRDWFSFKVANLQKDLGEPLEKWTVKAEKNNVYGTRNVFIDTQGRKFSVGYQGNSIDESHAFVVQMISTYDWMLLLQYGTAFDDIVRDAKESIESEIMEL